MTLSAHPESAVPPAVSAGLAAHPVAVDSSAAAGGRGVRMRNAIGKVFDPLAPLRPRHGQYSLVMWAAVSVGCALLLALGMGLGVRATAIVVSLIGLLLIPGWPVLLGLDNRRVTRIVMLLTLPCAVLAAYFGSIDTTMMVAAGAIIASFIGQMCRRDGRGKLIEHISAGAAGALFIVCASLWIHVARLGELTHQPGKVSLGANLPRTNDLLGVSSANAGIAVGWMIAVSIAVCAIIYCVDSPRTDLLAILNGAIVGGLSGLGLAEMPLGRHVGWLWAVGIASGIAVAVAYAFMRRALRNVSPPLPWIHGVTKAVSVHCAVGVVGWVLTWFVV
ncbi:hypothetical protein [Trueperella sp. LYQ141]|uniref:hypothetical protein n=1 Tax=Trueperella sp. LYQ141 TaxID=3391058 RepID=UPI00398346C5